MIRACSDDLFLVGIAVRPVLMNMPYFQLFGSDTTATSSNENARHNASPSEVSTL
jgi:hypothetical protein